MDKSSTSTTVIVAIVAGLSGIVGALAGGWLSFEGQKIALQIEIIRRAGENPAQSTKNLIFWQRLGFLKVSTGDLRQAACDCLDVCEEPGRPKIVQNKLAC
jgi:hypothetical protein